MPDDGRMDVQRLAGLTDQELIVFALREATLMVCAEIEPGKATRDLVSRLLALLDRNDVVAARNRLERHYRMKPLPISDD
jgi:hypothetical protein